MNNTVHEKDMIYYGHNGSNKCIQRNFDEAKESYSCLNSGSEYDSWGNQCRKRKASIYRIMRQYSTCWNVYQGGPYISTRETKLFSDLPCPIMKTKDNEWSEMYESMAKDGCMPPKLLLEDKLKAVMDLGRDPYVVYAADVADHYVEYFA